MRCPPSLVLTIVERPESGGRCCGIQAAKIGLDYDRRPNIILYM